MNKMAAAMNGHNFGWRLTKQMFPPVAAFLFATACVQSDLNTAPASPPIGDTQSLRLGVTSHFSHGWPPEYLTHADKLGVKEFRDALRWHQIEQTPGVYVFDKWRTTYPDEIADRDAKLSITLLGTNQLYDEGGTVHTDAGVQALADFTVAALDRFPAIHAVEIGNEINGENFVFGEVRRADYPERATLYVDKLRGVYDRVKDHKSEVRVVGAGVHSVPVAFLELLFKRGAGQFMDALVIHPYTSAPETLAKELAYLRSKLPTPVPPIDVSEFGVREGEDAANYLIKMVCVMATQGVENAHWYPLSKLGKSKSVPLIDDSGMITAAGRAFRFARTYLLSHRLQDVSPDNYTFAYQVGDRTLVIWGEERGITVSTSTVAAFAADGTRLEEAPKNLSMDRVLILTSRDQLRLGQNVILGDTAILADSFHDFTPFAEPGSAESGDTFDRFFARDDFEIKLRAMGGGERKATPWTPYLSTPHHRPMYIGAQRMAPGAFGSDLDNRRNFDIVHRFTADRDMEVVVKTDWAPSGASTDGVRSVMVLNDVVISDEVIIEAVLQVTPSLLLSVGDRIEIRLGVNKDPRGDTTDYRIQVVER